MTIIDKGIEFGHISFEDDEKKKPYIVIEGKRQNKSQKKSARFSKLKKEEILPVKISNQKITIHIIPISPEEHRKKRVRGYKYLTV